MLVQLEVNGLSVNVALDEGDDIDAAMGLVTQIKALAEQLSDYDGVEVYIASPIHDEYEDDTDDYEEE